MKRSNNKTSIFKQIMSFVSISVVLVMLSSTNAIAVVVLPSTDTQQMHLNNGLLTATPEPEPVVAGVLVFSENFDAQANWVGAAGGGVLSNPPTNWDAGYQVEAWHPDTVPGSKPNMAINSEQAFSGKSFITYSESEHHGSGWASDGIILKDIAPTARLYVKFKIKFQPGFAGDLDRGMIKIIRAGHFDGGTDANRFKFFGTGHTAPIYIFDWVQNSYGVRQQHAFRCDSQEASYYCPGMVYNGASLSGGSDSSNFSEDLVRFNTILPDLVNGGNLPTSGIVSHNQVYGDVWHDIAFYLELNSEPGLDDGKFRLWFDGQLISGADNMPWIMNGGSMEAKWNFIGIGGNDYFHWDIVDGEFTASKERWYSLDNLEIYNGMPEGVDYEL